MLVMGITSGCDAQVKTTAEAPAQVTDPERFADYWYAGKAELSRYRLTQMRYDQPRNGEVVLVYVTEDFLPERQVKDERGSEGAVKVLKLNAMKKFETGIYDYSLMTSVFTPVDYRKSPYTLKVTFGAQDWCGQSFSQVNLRDRTLEYEHRSYFESEGDANETREATYFEEDLWTRMRLEPQMLPLGEVEIIPSLEFLRLNHLTYRPQAAKAVLLLQVDDKGGETYVYKLEYTDIGRKMTWRCESQFPYRLLGWEEEVKDGNGAWRKTKATRTHQVMDRYWERNSIADAPLRDSLGVRFGLGEE